MGPRGMAPMNLDTGQRGGEGGGTLRREGTHGYLWPIHVAV